MLLWLAEGYHCSKLVCVRDRVDARSSDPRMTNRRVCDTDTADETILAAETIGWPDKWPVPNEFGGTTMQEWRGQRFFSSPCSWTSQESLSICLKSDFWKFVNLVCSTSRAVSLLHRSGGKINDNFLFPADRRLLRYLDLTKVPDSLSLHGNDDRQNVDCRRRQRLK